MKTKLTALLLLFALPLLADDEIKDGCFFDKNGDTLWVYYHVIDGKVDTNPKHLAVFKYDHYVVSGDGIAPAPECLRSLVKKAAVCYTNGKAGKRGSIKLKNYEPGCDTYVQVQEPKKENRQEDLVLSDAMYKALWNELLEWQQNEAWHHATPEGFSGGYVDEKVHSAYRHRYGVHWNALSLDTRKHWFNIMYPQIEFKPIWDWAMSGRKKNYEDAQRNMNGPDGSSSSGSGGGFSDN